MRKFKHKQTGIKAVLEPEIERFYCIVNETPEGFNELLDEEINLKLVDNSNDWQEITPELVKGKWYVADNSVFRYCYVKDGMVWGDNFAGGDHKKEIGQGLIDTDGIAKMICDSDMVKRKATPSEIHKALDAIRIEKGLVEGVKAKSAVEENEGIIKGIWGYHGGGRGSFYVTTGEGLLCIYYDGEWGTKVSKPILVTEDGYEKVDGDKILYVDIECTGRGIKDIREGSFDESIVGFLPYIKTFHHKENAQAYIENHKPRFSRAEYEADLEWLKEKASDITTNIAPYSFNHARFYRELSELIRQLKSK